VVGEEVGDRLDDLSAEEHPRLRRVHPDVAEDGLQLGADEVGRRLVDRAHLSGRLRGQRHDCAHPVTSKPGERLQVRLDAGAAAGVGAGDRETAWDHRG
jgi:hypothetical protein